MQVGDRIDEAGVLLRDGSGFYLRRERGGRLRLDLRRTPIDEVEHQVRVIGTFVGDDRVDVDGVQRID